MSDQSGAGGAGGAGDVSVPDSDPNHIDPAGDVADALEDQLAGAELTGDTDPDDLREFIDAAERGEFGPADPGLEATVRIARSILEAADDDAGGGE